MVIIESLYNRVRGKLPRKWTVYNGVAVRKARLFDRTDVDPDYEATYIDLLTLAIDPGDTVVLVGGGWGVSAVTAAQAAGDTGHVYVYEASPRQAEHVCETLTHNRTPAETTLRVAAIADGSQAYNDDVTTVISPTKIPDCDVLGLDCEGAEYEILEALRYRPREFVVEYHPTYDTTKNGVVRRLESLEVSNVQVRTDQHPRGIGHVHATTE